MEDKSTTKQGTTPILTTHEKGSSFSPPADKTPILVEMDDFIFNQIMKLK